MINIMMNCTVELLLSKGIIEDVIEFINGRPVRVTETESPVMYLILEEN